MANMRLHQIVVTGFAKSPDMHHDLIERTDIVGVRRKQVQQSAFRRRQANDFAITHDLMSDGIHTQWTYVNDCRRIAHQRRTDATTQRSQMREQLSWEKRLCEEAIRSTFEVCRLGIFTICRCKHEHQRNVCIAHLPTHGERIIAVILRVNNDNIWSLVKPNLSCTLVGKGMV